MATNIITVAEQAISGLEIAKAAGIVRVRDGEDTWACTESAWDAAVAKLSTAPYDGPYVDDDGTGTAIAYGQLCGFVAAPVITLNGTPKGTMAQKEDLARRAISAGLLNADEALAREFTDIT